MELAEGTIVSGGVGASAALCSRAAAMKERIVAAGELPGSTVAERLELVEQLQSFSIGRALVSQGALTGAIARAVAMWPTERASRGPRAAQLHPLESFLLDRSPTMLAFQAQHALASRSVLDAIASAAGRSASGCVAVVPSRLAELSLQSPPSILPLPARLCVTEPDQQLFSDVLYAHSVSSLAQNSVVEHQERIQVSGASHVVAGGLLDEIPSDADAVAELARVREMLAEGSAAELILCGWGPLGSGPEAASDDGALDEVLLRDVISLSVPGARTGSQLLQLASAAGFSSADIVLDGAAPVICARR